jgi:hypothetical protein
MARTPVRIQSGNFGTDNPSSFSPSYGNRSQSQPTVLQRGPSQGREQFTAEGLSNPEAVARALNAIQANVDTAVGPSKNRSVNVTTHKVAQDPPSLEDQTIAIYAGSPGNTGTFVGDVWVYR